MGARVLNPTDRSEESRFVERFNGNSVSLINEQECVRRSRQADLESDGGGNNALSSEVAEGLVGGDSYVVEAGTKVFEQ